MKKTNLVTININGVSIECTAEQAIAIATACGTATQPSKPATTQTKSAPKKKKAPAKAEAQDNGFDRKIYDATVKKLAKSGKIRLCQSGRPWAEDREIVYKAMGGKKGKDGKWNFNK